MSRKPYATQSRQTVPWALMADRREAYWMGGSGLKKNEEKHAALLAAKSQVVWIDA